MSTPVFQRINDDKIKRDRWGRPLIEPPEGGKPIAYTRVSTLSKALDNKEGLMKWRQRMTAIGIGKRPDLAQMALACSDDKRKIDEVVEAAMSAAESNKAANVGTTLHAFTEVIDAGGWPEQVSHEIAADLTAYKNAMANIEIVAAEQFIVCDEVRAAGTFDRLVRLPDGRLVIADIKTGQDEPKYPQGVTIQTAIYAHGHLYDRDKGRLTHLPEVGVSTDVGLLIHMPAGQGRCDLYLLNLTDGWTLAKTAVMVRELFKDNKPTPYTPAP